MEHIQEFFYWTTSIAMILFGLFIIGLMGLLLYLKRLVDQSMAKLDASLSGVANATRAWRNLAFTRFLMRAIRFIF